MIGEELYAEWLGDDADLALRERDARLIEALRPIVVRLIVVQLFGRPLIITPWITWVDAWVAAWLPRTEGVGVIDMLFGQRDFTGRLPYPWPHTVDQLPFAFANLL